jgi:hypothetical protein
MKYLVLLVFLLCMSSCDMYHYIGLADNPLEQKFEGVIFDSTGIMTDLSGEKVDVKEEEEQ